MEAIECQLMRAAKAAEGVSQSQWQRFKKMENSRYLAISNQRR